MYIYFKNENRLMRIENKISLGRLIFCLYCLKLFYIVFIFIKGLLMYEENKIKNDFFFYKCIFFLNMFVIEKV